MDLDEGLSEILLFYIWDLRENKGFTDVTLACEDGLQVEAHNVVLFAKEST